MKVYRDCIRPYKYLLKTLLFHLGKQKMSIPILYLLLVATDHRCPVLPYFASNYQLCVKMNSSIEKPSANDRNEDNKSESARTQPEGEKVTVHWCFQPSILMLC
jgi:hypothetical protein